MLGVETKHAYTPRLPNTIAQTFRFIRTSTGSDRRMSLVIRRRKQGMHAGLEPRGQGLGAQGQGEVYPQAAVAQG